MKEQDEGFVGEVNSKCKVCYFFESCKAYGCLMDPYEVKCYDFLSLEEGEKVEEEIFQMHKMLDDRADMIERLEEEGYWEN